MSKIKIVQISVSSHEDIVNEYLDDKGRVWYQTAVFTEAHDKSDGTRMGRQFSHYEWKQVELPNEPESAGDL